MSRRNLGEFEQIVLLATLKSGDAPYALEIRRVIDEVADRKVSRGALYRTFDRLSSKGYLVWTLEEDGPVPERGGHPMRRFAVTDAGISALRESRRTLLELWDGLEAELKRRMTRGDGPPRRAAALLRLCLGSAPERRSILGDLHQEYVELTRSAGRVRADLWYVRQIPGVGLWYLGRRVARALRLSSIGRFGRVAAVDLRANAAAAMREVRRHPGFSAAVIVTLALGLGANATMFGVVDRLLLSPPQHVVDADQLRFLSLEGLGQRSTNFPRSYAYPDYLAIVDLPELASAAAYAPPQLWTMDTGESARRVRVQRATASLFPTLGVAPVAGRFYGEGEDSPRAIPTVVLSEGLWEREFARDPGIIGDVLDLRTSRYQVVGVAPAGFTGPELSSVDLWVPLEVAGTIETSWAVLESRGAQWWRVVVRLADGVSDEVVEARLTAAHAAGVRAYEAAGGRALNEPGPGRIRVGSIIAGRGPNASVTTSISMWLGVVSLLVLLIACANVANLLLARGIRRRRTLAIRVSLGATRARLFGRLMTEATLLATLGGVAAVIVARWSSEFMHATLIPGVSFTDTALTGRLLTFIAIAAGLAALLAGVLPAVQAGGASPNLALDDRGRGNTAGRSRLRGALLVGQVAVSVVLLVGSGLFVRSLREASRTEMGFDHGRTIAVGIEPRPELDPDRRHDLHVAARRELATLPGVVAAGVMTSPIPLAGYNEQTRLRASGVDSIPRQPGGGPYAYSGTLGFMDALGVQITSGRSFDEAEFAVGGEAVVMVSESFVGVVWPDRDPLGECVRLQEGSTGLDGPEPCRPVIGVYQDVAVRGIDDEAPVSVAFPTPLADRSNGVVARVEGDPGSFVPVIRRRLLDMSADIRFVNIEPIANRVDRLIAPWRLGATMFSVFGALALTLSAVGLYSMLAFAVAEKRREIGIRAALGATRGNLVRFVAARAGLVVGLGLGIGGAVALAAGRWLNGVLFGVTASDPGVFGWTIVTLSVTAVLASILPTVRATSISPLTAIRSE